MSQEELREDIKHAKAHLYEMSNSALSVERIIKVAEQVLEAGDELPEKKEKREYGRGCAYDKDDAYEDGETTGWNNYADLCLPILAKKNLRIKELEKEVTGLRNEIMFLEHHGGG
jgi:translation initiation factor 2B subunit (eIF-2B alpha/beta/delta family)